MDPREENYNSDVQVEVSDSENSDSENDDQVSVIVDSEELIGMNATSAADEDEIQSPYNFEDFAREGMKKIEETERLFKDVKKRFLLEWGRSRTKRLSFRPKSASTQPASQCTPGIYLNPNLQML